MEKSTRLGSEECDARRQELTEKLSQLEIRISKAVELEDYDLAGTTIHVQLHTIAVHRLVFSMLLCIQCHGFTFQSHVVCSPDNQLCETTSQRLPCEMINNIFLRNFLAKLGEFLIASEPFCKLYCVVSYFLFHS